ncbi:MAG: cytochrome B [Methylococcaceae bacterium]|nr:cytochrome B [Methylococcaceae bacterium]
MKELTENSKPVWDIAIRVFHWSLVVMFVIAYLSGEDESELHIYAGYIILALISFRLVWGFIGSKHARFKDFIYSPSEILLHAKGLVSGQVKPYVGHNPLGGLMVIALLLTLLITVVSGLKVYGIEGHGPLAETNTSYFISSAHASNPNGYEANNHEDSDSEELWEEIHEFFANLTVFLIVFHILGVIISSKVENENLVKAMITGYKQNSKQQ